jgi:uncharacterized repeat protein (TIGR01451 family)
MDVGQSQLFNSTVTGGTLPYSYQWYLNYAPISGAISSTWTFTPASSGCYTVSLKITDNKGLLATSNSANVKVNGQLSVSILPGSVVMDVDQSQLFKSTVTGGTSPFSYQWHLNDTSVTGALSGSWTFTPSSAGSYTVYVEVTDAKSQSATSNTVNVLVNGQLSVSILPGSVVMDVDQSQLFNATVVAGTSPYSYQWYLNSASVSGATLSTWTFNSSSAGSYKIFVKVTDSAGLKVSSNIASVTVNRAPSVSISPGSVVMDVGQSQLFTSMVTAGTSPYSYQWYLNGTVMSNATSDSWTFTPSIVGSYKIYVKVTDSVGLSAVSNTASVTVKGVFSVSISPGSVVMDVGQSQLFTSMVTAGTSPYSYQWYLNGASVSNATLSTWTFTPTSAGSYKIYVKVTDCKVQSATSNIASVTVNGKPSVSILPTSVSMYVDQSQQFNATVVAGTSPYSYQWYLNGASVSSATLSTWTFTPTSAGSYTVYVKITDNVGVQATSNTANVNATALHPNISVSVKGPPSASEGNTITFTITITNTSNDTTMYGVDVYSTLLGDVSSFFSSSLAPGASQSESFSYTVPSPSGDITNTVTATYEDALQQQVTASASCTVKILHPGLSVSESGPMYAHEGDTITYTITVSNTGDANITRVSVVDSLLGDVSSSFSASLAPGASQSESFSYTVPSPSGDITDTVTATYNSSLNSPLTASASWSVIVLHPGISVSESGPLYAHVGDTVTFTITVSNTGDCALSGVLVTDTLLGTVYSGGLAVGASDTFTESYTVPSALAVISDSVSASGSDALGRSVSSSSGWSLTVLHPGISVSESGPSQAHVSDTITFTITVSNTGDCALSGVLVTDTLLGTVYSGGLAVGASDTFHVNYTVPSGLPVVSDSVSASGSDALGHVVSSSSSWSTTVLHPGINVSESAPAFAHEGDTITYTITVNNTGDATITRVSVVDSLLGDVSSSFSASLAPGASQSESFSYTVPSPSGDITNTVTATYEDSLQQQVTASASCTVTAIHPSISVSESGPSYAHEGDLITFTINVSNTGDCALSGVFVSDSLVGTIFSGSLAFGASDTFTESYTVPSPSTVVSDSVSASGNDVLGRVVSSSSGWSVTVLHPDISVSESGPSYAHEGDLITFTINVSNSGDCALSGVFVSDSLVGTIFSGSLAFGASDTFTESYTVPSPSTVVSDSVSASGNDVLGGLVSANSGWSVTVLHPDINVVKSGPTCAHVGDTINYTITVTNTGDCDLTSVLVVDNLLGTVYSGSLPAGASDTFTVNYTVPSGLALVSNTASASGSDVLGRVVSASSSWSVAVLSSGISVSESGPSYAHEGDTVSLTITVNNTGDATITRVSVVDSLLGDVSSSFSASLAPGASQSESFSYTVPSPSGDITNTVTAIYEDALQQQLTAEALWTVAILHPGITISTTAPPYAHVGDTVTFTITVSNTGDCDLNSVLVSDSLIGTVYSGGLAFGASDTFTESYTVPSALAVVSDSVSASGSDALGRSVSSSSGWSLTVLHPDIAVSKTGPLYAHAGDVITYIITVNNTGDCALNGVFVTDTLLGAVYTGSLAVGAFDTFSINYTVPSGLPILSNTVSASGTDVLGGLVFDSASWSVTVLHPGLSVSKSGPASAHAGDTITYVITVSNTGDCALNGVLVTDSILGTVYSGGLAVGASDTFSVNYTVPSGLTVVSNTVSASGSDALGGSVSASSSWSITVLHPGISVVESGPTYAHVSDTIAYTITITNTGDCTLSNVLVADSILGTVYSGGLAVGASDTFNVTYTVPSGLTVVSDSVSASGSDALGRSVSSSSGWSTTVLHPSISVSKSAPASAHVGDTITYTIVVKNTGDCALNGVLVTDSILGTVYSGGLAVGASDTFSVNYTVPSGLTVVSNTVSASGSDALGRSVSSSASCVVTIVPAPETTVVVTNISMPPWVYQGWIVDINVTVKNNGNFSEPVWVTLYYNMTADELIDAYPIELAPGQSYTLTFGWNGLGYGWNTSSVPTCYGQGYTITAVATIPTGSNMLSQGNMVVRIMGDVNGDGLVNMKDIALVARAFGSTPTSPNWNFAADLNRDGLVNMKDMALVARNFGKIYNPGS